MLSKVKSFGLQGVNCFEVVVEADVHNGLPGIEMVGLADTVIKESRERVRSAIKNSGLGFSPKKITLNLAPADMKKEGAMYDLPIAVALLAATEQLPIRAIRDIIFVGELSLDGGIRHINGLLPILLAARERGYKRIIVPYDNRSEAGFVDGIDVYALSSLRETVLFLSAENGELDRTKRVESRDLAQAKAERFSEGDMKYVMGQYAAKRALEIAAAGGHNILLIGPPGAGKTMLARCVPSIMPDMSTEEILETTKLHSIAGVLDVEKGVVTTRPFRSPHHTVSRIALTGGGSDAHPGEISLAHNGILFLDELLEYPRTVLEILRQPLEDNRIFIARAARTIDYPANFMLVASMNPCPCGHFGSQQNECTCTPAQIARYHARLSGPLLDRIDLHIEADNVTYDDLASTATSEPSEKVRERVNAARLVQQQRYAGTGVYANAKMNSQMVKTYCALDDKGENLLKTSFERLGLSARAYTRILKVARTIADLAHCEKIEPTHIAEAVQYRSLDRSYWK